MDLVAVSPGTPGGTVEREGANLKVAGNAQITLDLSNLDPSVSVVVEALDSSTPGKPRIPTLTFAVRELEEAKAECDD